MTCAVVKSHITMRTIITFSQQCINACYDCIMTQVIDVTMYVVEYNLHAILGIGLVYPLIFSSGRYHSDAYTQSLFIQGYVLEQARAVKLNASHALIFECSTFLQTTCVPQLDIPPILFVH